jgi:2-C-methyl-D-erythritol 2,4-cyclodiphosphate synthase
VAAPIRGQWPRVGQGYDIHRLVPERALILAGITLPSDVGLAGHSDGDVVCHAVIDAILGAAAMGDIGERFPDDDPRFEGASSLDLLAGLRDPLREAGFDVANVDVTVILEVPKLRPYSAQMKTALAGALDIPPDRVSVKAKSNERLGAIGAGEAIAALAVVLLAPAGG